MVAAVVDAMGRLDALVVNFTVVVARAGVAMVAVPSARLVAVDWSAMVVVVVMVSVEAVVMSAVAPVLVLGMPSVGVAVVATPHPCCTGSRLYV